MSFIRYPKIRRVGAKNLELLWSNILFISEKLDGSNIQIRRIGDEIQYGSRNQFINERNQFYNYLAPIRRKDFSRLPENVILFGECCMNQCTIKYETTKPFLLFDVGYLNSEGVLSLGTHIDVVEYALKYGLERIQQS